MSYVIDLRRELHEHPEIGFDLPETLAIVRRELDGMGVEYTEKYGRSSIVATVNPEKSHFTIGIRADMDALPMEEQNDVTYKSKNPGKMHACGHDAHTAIAIAALREIYAMRDKISCRVKFLFQPAEEYNTSGASLMAADGVMDDIDCIVALHCDTSADVGVINIIDGDRNAISNGFELNFYGKSAHAAHKSRGIDAIYMASRAYVELTNEITEEKIGETCILNVGRVRGGETNNIVCDYCSLFATLRSFSDERAEYTLSRIKEICSSVAREVGGRFEFVSVKHYPKVHNDPKIAEAVRAAARRTEGVYEVGEEIRNMGGEDFSYFANLKPGAMFRLGIRNEERGIVNALHKNNFDVDERALDIGVRVFVNFVLDNMMGI